MKRMIRIVALLMAALMTVTSCQAPASGSQLTSETVDVSFAGPSARTITTDDGLVQTVPTSDLWFQYKAVWKGSGDPPSTATSGWKSLDGQGLTGTVKLHRGTWELSLRAFVNESDLDNDSKYILSGTLPRVEIGANNVVTQTVAVSLGYVRQEGNGTLHISATYPVVYREGVDSELPVEAVRKVKVTANVSDTDYTGEITAFDSNNVGTLDLTVPAGAAHVTVQYYMDDSTLFEDDKASKDVLIMATMTTNLAVSVDRDITAVTFKAEQPVGTVEDNVIPKVFNSLFDIYPDTVASYDIVIGYAEEAKALNDQTPITYPYTIYASATPDGKGRYKASDLKLVPITVPFDSNPDESGATEAWFGKDVWLSSPATMLVSVALMDGTTSIRDQAFKGCTALTNVTIPDSVTSIDKSAFRDCTSLANITIPESVTNIGNYTFRGCTSLTSITIPDSVTSIGENAFYKCSNLTDVTLGRGLTSLPSSLFDSCSRLENITIPDTVTEIGSSVFSGTNIQNLNIPITVTKLSETWGRLLPSSAQVTYEGTTAQWYSMFGKAPYYFTGTGVSYIDLGCSDGKIVFVIGPNDAGNGELITLTPHGKTLDTITVPAGYEIIEKGASETGNVYGFLYDCSNVVTVILPDGIERINNHMFRNCSSLENITIPDSVTSIGQNAFVRCSNLRSIEIPSSVTSIERSAFSYCNSLQIINIPNGVTSIGDYVGEYSAIREVHLPSTINYIGTNAFEHTAEETRPGYYTSSPYKLVTFDGTVANWINNVQECDTRATNASNPMMGAGIGIENDIQCTDGKPVFITNKSQASVIGLRPYGKTLTTLEVPAGFTSITFLTSATPAATTLILPASMETVSNNVFSRFTNLTNVYIDKAEGSIDFSNAGLPEGCSITWNSTGSESV